MLGYFISHDHTRMNCKSDRGGDVVLKLRHLDNQNYTKLFHMG